MKDDKIFIYLRLRDDKKTLLKSRIREFAAIGKLLGDFIKEVSQKFGFRILNAGNLEYVDANSDLVLIAYKRDVVLQRIIINGFIPAHYQERMLDEHATKVKFSGVEFIDSITFGLDPLQKSVLKQHIQHPPVNILALIKENIDKNGEFYIILNLNTP